MAASTSAALSFADLCASRSSSIAASSLNSPRPSSPSVKRAAVIVCRAEKSGGGSEVAISRRSAVSLAAAAAALGMIATPTSPAQAAYGEAANIFGAQKKNTDYITFTGDGFKVDIPSKWNPSKEQEFPGTVLRYEDNFDPNSNFAIMVLPADKPSIKEYGPPEKFLDSVSYLLGKQAFSGNANEGGFDPNAVATAAILESSTPTINGKQYYNISVLTRTADGDEGGKHQLIVATVSGGKLFLCKAQAGDKRWFKGAKKFVEGVANSFSVA